MKTFGFSTKVRGGVNVGDFKNDYKEGRGKFVLSNGEYFEGEFHNDSINGRGVFRTAENEKVEGIWENNVLVRLIQ